MQDFEKLGVFYLGKEKSIAGRESDEELLLYDSKDLTTHAVVVGMTGSGKTGLCVDLLEEAGMDRIPAIVIDPKGDISNLLLTFPDLDGKSFEPWVDSGQASREGMSVPEFAESEAAKWKKGLDGWGQDGERIRTFRENVDLRVYTPGSSSGRPVTVLKSFNAPPKEVLNDSDAFRERISATTSGLLALMGIEADPIRSSEHILISKILETHWEQGKSLDLGRLISEIMDPPFQRVGVMELDAFFSAKDRNELAMTMNNLLASPSFSSWLQGEPLNIKSLLHTPEGKPCISIMSISHLSDAERMFFVTILLNEVLSWVRSQAGTSSLRAILYMDEVFGYFPPTKNPPSKQPMLTLLKQARAFGLGVVLATQNPVDLDYKGLSNTGTWFLGRLQTERDKARVLEGLEGAAAQTGTRFNKREMEQILAGLGKRKFLMNNVHDDEPVVFETRWAMSYLRGPLTKNQLVDLVGDDAKEALAQAESLVANSRPSAVPAAEVNTKPTVDSTQFVPKDIPQRFVEPAERVGSNDRLLYRPVLLGRGRLHFVRATYKIDEWKEMTFLADIKGGEMPDEVWENAKVASEDFDFNAEPPQGAEFADLPEDLQVTKNYKSWQKEFKEFLYRGQELEVWKCNSPKKYSEAYETLGDFKVRLEQDISEKRDEAVEKLRKKYGAKFTTMRDKIRRAEDKIDVEKAQYREKSMSSKWSMGASILGALLGRKTLSATNVRRASSAMGQRSRVAKEKDDIDRAEDKLEDLEAKFKDLEVEFKEAVTELEEKLSVENLEFEDLAVPPRKSDISIEDYCVCWLPWRVDSNGIAEPIY
jgi:hypothetical protein